MATDDPTTDPHTDPPTESGDDPPPGPDTALHGPGRPAPRPRSRRTFLGLMGAGVGGAVAAPSAASAQSAPEPGGPGGRGGRGGRGAPPPDGPRGREPASPAGVAGDRFGRMFELPPFAEPSPELRAALVELGRPGGIMDAGDPLEVGPLRLLTEPELSPNNRDNPGHHAGMTFMGQFLDHDITLDAGSRLGRPTPARRSTNLRSARFDLDSVYGGGPDESPELYDGFRLRVESGGRFEDLPRDDDGAAIIADPRNDENLLISALHAAFLLFHNAVLDDVAGGRATEGDFARARQLVRWHYQWIIVHEVLPQFIGQQLVDDILGDGRRVFTPRRARIPLEFQTAAYRFGHSQIRPSYGVNRDGDGGEPFVAFVFDPDESGRQDPDDLSGGHRAPRRFVDWESFFDVGDGEVKPNKRIDTHLSSPLFRLPTDTIPTVRGEPVGPTSLATRNLLRHVTWEIPSGQRVAAEMGVEPLAAADLADVAQLGADLARSTPLFFYLLREAEVMEDGTRLGPCGGRIVGEVFIALLQMDATSYLHAAPRGRRSWTPTLPRRSGSVTGDFTMADLLTIAGVDPAARGR